MQLLIESRTPAGFPKIDRYRMYFCGVEDNRHGLKHLLCDYSLIWGDYNLYFVENFQFFCFLEIIDLKRFF